MEQRHNWIWTWCPKCTIRTEHELQKNSLHCLVCGCNHRGAVIINNQEILSVQDRSLPQRAS